LKNSEVDWQALFHPDAVFTKGYALLGWAAEELPSNENVDSWVHHLSAIQGNNGQWYNNLPRPPIQSSDISATALAVHALQRYPLPGRQAQFAAQVKRARHWLWQAKPENNESRIYQILGLAWAGEPARKLQPLAKALIAEQHRDGGWSQVPGLGSDAYATAQATYALRVGAKLDRSHPAIDRGVRFLLEKQLEDGTWHVRRRAFPFQPTMNSGFPHGRDSWISAAASSWAVMALSVCDQPDAVAVNR
jgi:N-acyl-D-amino-acid deacylase